MNHADAGLPPDCGGGGSTTFASKNLDEIKLKNTAFERDGAIPHGMETQVLFHRPGNSSNVALLALCPCS